MLRKVEQMSAKFFNMPAINKFASFQFCITNFQTVEVLLGPTGIQMTVKSIYIDELITEVLPYTA